MRTTTPILVLLLSMLAASCGGDPADMMTAPDAATPDKAAPFVGSWNATSAITTITCASGTYTSNAISPDAFERGASSDLIMTTACAIHFNVAGATASAVPGSSCMTGASSTLIVGSWTFTTSDGHSATEAIRATANIPDPTTGAPVSCSLVETGTYTKVGG